MHSSKALTAQIHLITNGFGDRHAGGESFFLLASENNCSEKICQNAVLPVLLLAADLQTKSVKFLHFLQFGWNCLELNKYKNLTISRAIGDKIDCSVKRFRFSNFS